MGRETAAISPTFLIGVILILVFISSCSNQRYAHRMYVRVDQTHDSRNGKSEALSTEPPKPLIQDTVALVFSEFKEQASAAIAEREQEQVPGPGSISKPRQSLARRSTPITTLAFKKKSSNLEIKEITGIWLSLLLIILGFLLFGIAGLLLLVGLGGSGYLGLFVIAGLFLLSGSILFIKSIYDSFHEDGELKGKRSNYILFSILLLLLIIGLSLVTVNLPLMALIISYFAALFLIATLTTAILG